MEAIAQHEADLTSYALEQLSRVPGIQIFGDTRPEYTRDRLGVIPFRLENFSHFLVSAILGYEFAIGVRSGCFCAHPYILHLLGLTQAQAQAVRTNMLSGDKSDMPGLIRASFGLYNTTEDIDALVEALIRISRTEYQGVYMQNFASGEYSPKDWAPDYDQFFSHRLTLLGSRKPHAQV